MNRTITFIHGLVGDAIGLLAQDAWDALAQARCVFYPGQWLPAALVDLLGARLYHGRHLNLTDLLRLAETHTATVVLFNGDGSVCSGIDGRFSSATQLRGIFEMQGYDVRDIAGASSVFMALRAAGWELPEAPQAQLTLATPLCRSTGGLDELRLLAEGPSLLALLWWEDRGEEALRVLLQLRGAVTPAALVRAIGTPEEETHVGTLATVAARLPVAPPAVLLVQPCVEHLPPPLLDAASAWAVSCPPGITWLLGPPGSGKSTWLRALHCVAPDLRTAELGEIARPLMGPDRYLPGGFQALGHAAQMVRTLASHNPDRRFVVAGTLLPDWALQHAPGSTIAERIVLLGFDPERAEHQRRSRPTRHKATDAQARAHLDALHHLETHHPHESLEVPYLPQLLGRHSP